MPKWTHRIEYVNTGGWWFGYLSGGKLFHTALTKPGQAPNPGVHSFELTVPLDEFYCPPLYKVIKVNNFKGNK